MKLVSTNGNALDISVAGYQFPDAADRRQRFSWHQVSGTASVGEASWSFGWPALTCDESPRVGAWLRSLAEATTRVTAPDVGTRPRLAFTEPNLAFAILELRPGSGLLRVELDLEFHRDRSRSRAGDPYLVDLEVTDAQLMDAADQWDREVERFPDELPAT